MANLDKSQIMGAGRTLFKQGDKGGDLYFILEGQVELTVKDPAGNEVVVATLGNKSVIGTMSFLEGDPRSATAIAKTEIKYLLISQQQRDKLLQSIPTWVQVLIKDLSKNMRRLNDNFAKIKTDAELIEKRLKVKEKQKAEQVERGDKFEKDLSELRTQTTEEIKGLKDKNKELESQVADLTAKLDKATKKK